MNRRGFFTRLIAAAGLAKFAPKVKMTAAPKAAFWFQTRRAARHVSPAYLAHMNRLAEREMSWAFVDSFFGFAPKKK